MSELLSTPQLAEKLGLTPNTLEKWRLRGEGPAYLRVGESQVRYDSRDVDAWLDTRRVTSTSQAA